MSIKKNIVLDQAADFTVNLPLVDNNGEKYYKSFPQTEEGLEEAIKHRDIKREEFNYLPIREVI